MKPDPQSSLWTHLTNFTIRYDRIILGTVLVVTLIFTYFLFHLKVASDIKDFYREDSRKLIETIENDFGEGEPFVLIFESKTDKSLLAPELLHQQYKILQEIKRQYKITTLSLVDAIDEGLKGSIGKSILDIEDYETIGGAIYTLAGPRTVVDLEKVSRHLLSHPKILEPYQDLRIASSLFGPLMSLGHANVKFNIPFIKAMRVYARLDPGYTDKEKAKIIPAIRDLATSLSTPELSVHSFAPLLVGHDIDQAARQNTPLMGLIPLIVNIILLWLVFRRSREVWLTLFILLTSCIWTFGTASLLGLKISFLHLIVIPILLGTGIDDTVVFSKRFTEECAHHSDFISVLRTTFIGTGKGIFLTTMTTCLAFLCCAILSGSKAVTSFNLLVSISMVVVLILTILLQGAVRSMITRLGIPLVAISEKGPSPLSKKLLKQFSSNESMWVIRYPRVLIIAMGTLFITALISGFQVDSEFGNHLVLRQNMPSYVANQVTENYFKYNFTGYILFEGQIENPLLFQKIRQLENQLNNMPFIEKILRKANIDSINTLFDKMRIRISKNTDIGKALDRITESDEVANWITGQTYREVAKGLVRKSGDNYDGLLLRLMFSSHGDGEKTPYKILKDEITSLNFNEIPNIRIRIGGGGLGTQMEGEYYLRDLIQSFLLSLLMSFIILIIIWRKFWLACLAMIPIIFSVTLTIGLMPLLGIKLNVLNLCVGAIAVGLGVDYPIHLIERFEEEKKRGSTTPLQAVRISTTIMGVGLMVSVLTTIIGFASACILALPIAMSFGLLTAVAIFLTYLSSVSLLPLLLVQRRK